VDSLLAELYLLPVTQVIKYSKDSKLLNHHDCNSCNHHQQKFWQMEAGGKGAGRYKIIITIS
jgi:hypothetical protein